MTNPGFGLLPARPSDHEVLIHSSQEPIAAAAATATMTATLEYELMRKYNISYRQARYLVLKARQELSLTRDEPCTTELKRECFRSFGHSSDRADETEREAPPAYETAIGHEVSETVVIDSFHSPVANIVHDQDALGTSAIPSPQPRLPAAKPEQMIGESATFDETSSDESTPEVTVPEDHDHCYEFDLGPILRQTPVSLPSDAEIGGTDSASDDDDDEGPPAAIASDHYEHQHTVAIECNPVYGAIQNQRGRVYQQGEPRVVIAVQDTGDANKATDPVYTALKLAKAKGETDATEEFTGSHTSSEEELIWEIPRVIILDPEVIRKDMRKQRKRDRRVKREKRERKKLQKAQSKERLLAARPGNNSPQRILKEV